MAVNFVDFLPDIQSITVQESTGCVLFFDSCKCADTVWQILLRDFHVHSILDIDNIGVYYVIPLKSLDENLLSQFIHRGWDWDRDQKFIQYTMTFYSADSATKIYNMLIAGGFNVTVAPNNMQLIVKCLDNSPRNSEIKKLQNDLLLAQKSAPQSMDDYLNKILFYGIIENVAYRTICKQEFTLDEIETNKDIIVRGILYQYFNKRIRAYLEQITFPKKFNANKLNDKEKQNINVIRDFLYAMATEYVDIQTIKAARTKHGVIIRFDYLKSCNKYDKFRATLKSANQWLQKQDDRNREIVKIKEQSMNQVYKVMDCDNGYYFVILFSPSALQYCGKHMHHCIQNAYWANAIKNDDQELYSLRDRNGEPHITIEVNHGKVVQCQGRPHTPPNRMFREMVRQFMNENNLDIPDINGWNKHIAYIKQNGELYDVFNLPKNFVIDNRLDLCGMGLNKLPDMSTVTVNGNFLCATNNLSNLNGAPKTVNGDCNFDGNPLISLYGIPRNISGKIYLSGTQLTSKSFVPIYMQDKLYDIVGIDDKIIFAWKEQIALRKTQIQNIITSLSLQK